MTRNSRLVDEAKERSRATGIAGVSRQPADGVFTFRTFLFDTLPTFHNAHHH
jgi:hypothetical protein